MSAILHLQKATQSKSLPSRLRFTRWTEAVLNPSLLSSSVLKQRVKKFKSPELTFRLVDEAESAELNETYRHKQGPTNVLSFPTEAIPGIDWFYLGDIVMCAPLVLKEAAAQNKIPSAHWAHLTIHGILHLLGFDHIEEQDAIIMEGLEIELLSKMGLPNPYATKVENLL